MVAYDLKTYTTSRISKEMAESGHDRNLESDSNKIKIKKMKRITGWCRDHNKRSGNNRNLIEYMYELDVILGHRPSLSRLPTTPRCATVLQRRGNIVCRLYAAYI